MLENGEQQMKAMVTLASENGESLMVAFDGMFAGYVGMMPLLADDRGVFRDLVTGSAVTVKRLKPGDGEW